MKSIVLAVALAMSAAPQAEAADAPARPLQLRPKVMSVEHRSAPFVNPTVSEPELELIPRHDLRQEASRSSCARATSLCYDPASGRIVYKPARQFMPDIPGLQRENISIKRDRIVFRYSFQ